MRFEGKFSDVYMSNTKWFVGEYACGLTNGTHFGSLHFRQIYKHFG
jgi:hypothetical protein